jgi:hypothetical protein
MKKNEYRLNSFEILSSTQHIHNNSIRKREIKKNRKLGWGMDQVVE